MERKRNPGRSRPRNPRIPLTLHTGYALELSIEKLDKGANPRTFTVKYN